jgi:hypothetical protein
LKLKSISVNDRQKYWLNLREGSGPGKSTFPQMTQRSRLALEPWGNPSHFLERALLKEEKGAISKCSLFSLLIQGSHSKST